jgi:hypothetical protein
VEDISHHEERLLAALARLVAVTIASQAAPAAADDNVIESYESRRCIKLSAINSMQVVNDQDILFYMRGRKFYLNTLRPPCIGLASAKRYSFKADSGKLCERDRIKFFHGVKSCALGRFEPISREGAEALLNRQPEPPQTPLELPPIEDVVPPAPKE